MNEQITKISEAFSRKALVYDQFGKGHTNLDRMRAIVRSQVCRLLNQGDAILELNAGTGADAVFFARQGYRVHAIDIAPGMIAQIHAKAAEQKLESLITVQRCSYTQLQNVKAGPFNLIFSNMGGLNCTHDLTVIARSLAKLLLPGGFAVLVVMPPVCPWELLHVLKVGLRPATRRLARGGRLSNVEGVSFLTYYYTPGQVQRAFGPDYFTSNLRGLSVFTPTADNKVFPSRHPRLFEILRRVDDRLSAFWPFNQFGDFFILTLRYLPRGKL
jgi:ubiquinone/menaquinone biosynthesis C-methylase UbiE